MRWFHDICVSNVRPARSETGGLSRLVEQRTELRLQTIVCPRVPTTQCVDTESALWTRASQRVWQPHRCHRH